MPFRARASMPSANMQRCRRQTVTIFAAAFMTIFAAPPPPDDAAMPPPVHFAACSIAPVFALWRRAAPPLMPPESLRLFLPRRCRACRHAADAAFIFTPPCGAAVIIDAFAIYAAPPRFEHAAASASHAVCAPLMPRCTITRRFAATLF